VPRTVILFSSKIQNLSWHDIGPTRYDEINLSLIFFFGAFLKNWHSFPLKKRVRLTSASGALVKELKEEIFTVETSLFILLKL
jgi:hypothetical protein